MKKFIITFFSILLIGLTSIGGGLLLSACDNFSYSENGGGNLDNSENENDENLSDGDEEEIVAQAITVGDYWRYSVFNGSSTAGQYHGCSITYQPYNGSYNPSYGTWTYSAQGTAQDYYGYNRFTFSSGGYVQVNPVGHTTGTGEGYRFMGCSTSWNGLNSYMTSTVGTARYIYNGGINYSSPPTRGFSFSSTNINIYGIFRYCYTIALTNQGSTSYYYVPKGTSFTLPTPTRTGYNFLSWSGYTGTLSNVTSNYSLTAQWEAEPSYYLDINTYLDEDFASGGFSGYTFNVYENGNMIYNNATDMYHPISYGSTVKIEISNIPNDSSLWRADYPGGSSTSTTFTFTMPNENSWVNLYFVNPYWLDTNIYIDDEYFIGGVTNFTFNIYENDNMIYNNYTDVYHQIRFRSTVKIELTNMADGYYLSKIAYPGGETSESSATFTMPAENAAITLYFTSHTYSVSFDATNYVEYPYLVGGGPVQYNYVVHETYSNQFGTQVLRVEFTDSNGGGVYFYVPALIEGEEYKWTVDLRLSTATGSQTKHLSSLGHEMNGTIEADLTTSWQTFTHTFTAQFPSHGAFSFVFYANSDLWQAGDVLYIKNCSVQKVSDMTSENALGSISVPFNSQYSNLPTPSRTGYTFDGWQLGVDYGPNGIDNYGSIGVDTGGITRRIYPTKTYTNSIFQVGTIIYFDISWDTGNLTHVDVNDMAVNLSNFTVTSNRCIGKYTITSDQFINTYSFIDFTFDSTQTILSVNNYVVTGGLDYGPNGINNYSIQSFDQGTKRLQLGDSYENSTFKVGSVISFDISWDIGTLNSIDINDIFLGEGDYAISGNRCNVKYTITSTNFIGQFSFIDFNFESAATTITVNKFMVDNIIDSNEIVQVPGNHFLFPIWTINTYRLDVNTYVNSLNIYPNEYNYDFLFDIYFDGELVADDTKDYMNEAVPYNTEITFEIVQGHAGYDFTNITYNRLQATEQNITFNMPANSCEIGVYFVSHVYTATLKYQNGEPDTNLYLKYGVGWFKNSSCTQETTVITIPTRAGYNFGGFYVDENGNGTQTIDNSGMIVVSNTFASNNMIFYAKWEAKNPAYYDEEQGLWYIEMGKYPQTRLGDESVISELDILRESGAVTEFTYIIGNYTLNSYIYNENEYAYFEESNAYYLVEPVKYYLAGDYEEGYGIENGNVTAVTEQIVFVSEWSSTKLSLGDGYTSSTIRTNLNTFVGNSQINSDYLNTNSYTIKNFKDVNGVSTDTTLSADMIISNESEVETVFGDLSAEFSDLVSDILGNNLMYWTRDVGSNLNTAECITRLGSPAQSIMQKVLGVRITANVSTFGCLWHILDSSRVMFKH